MWIEVWNDGTELTSKIVRKDMYNSEYLVGSVLLDKSGSYWKIEEIMLRPYKDVAILFVVPQPAVNKV